MTTMTETADVQPRYTIAQINDMVENREIDHRNILDEFKGLTNEEVMAEQERRQTDMVVIAMGLSSDFNKGTIFRSFMAFAGKAFYFLNKPNNQTNSPEGTKKWDTRGTVGTTHYLRNIHHYDARRYQELFDELRADGYTIVAVDNIPECNPQAYYNVQFPEKTAFIVGEEATGIPIEVTEAADYCVYIPQRGVTPRSLNVASAFSIIAADFMRQNYPEM